MEECEDEKSSKIWRKLTCERRAVLKKVGNIIRAEESRRYVIPSAPGKRFSDDVKVTDMLYKCYGAAVKGKKFHRFTERYSGTIQ